MGTEGQGQSLSISKEIRTQDQIIIGFAERHGFNVDGEKPFDRMLSPRYIQEATAYYHTLLRIQNKDYILPDFNKLLADVVEISKIGDLSKRMKAIQQYIETGVLPEDSAA